MRTVEEAINILTDRMDESRETIEKPLFKSLNKILAEDIYAPIDVPNFPKSAMDGYAVRSKDFSGEGEKELKVIDNIRAGDDGNVEALKDTAVRIMTGGMIPEGYDAVVRQEDTDYGMDRVKIKSKPKAYDFYCPQGEDIRKGSLVLEKGSQIKALHLGLLASLGMDRVKVIEDMKVSILATGDEILNPEEELVKGHIYGSSGYILGGYLKSSGIELKSFNNSRDDKEMLKTDIREALKESHILLTTGGVSVGEKDLLPDVLREISDEVLFKRVNMKPGTPAMAARIGDKLVLSFSGNPFAAQVNFHVLFWPLASKFYGSKDLANRYVEAGIVEGTMYPSNMLRYVRAKYENGRVYLNEDTHESSIISNMIECNALVIQEPNRELGKGDSVRVIHLKEV